jgi:hypothetical protein
LAISEYEIMIFEAFIISLIKLFTFFGFDRLSVAGGGISAFF